MYRILIVDDEKIERNGIRLLLGRQGRALDSAQALDLFGLETKKAA